MLCDDELVAPDTLSLVVRADKRGETQTEASVLAVAGIEQYIPYVNPLQKIVLCKFLVIHCFLFYCFMWGVPCCHRWKRTCRSCSGSSLLAGSS